MAITVPYLRLDIETAYAAHPALDALGAVKNGYVKQRAQT